jgi:ABC-type glutathione transport system ATPase component
MSATQAAPLLEVSGLGKRFAGRRRWFGAASADVVALADIAFSVSRGESFGLVGESGSGKSTLGRCLTRLLTPDTGHIRFDGSDITMLTGTALRRARRRFQFVHQDATGALDPRFSVGQLLAEPLAIHGIGDRESRRAAVADILPRVGLTPDIAARRSHQLSGGQRQRIGLARALMLKPELLVLDEPVSALDVSVQAQMLNLLRELQQAFGLTYVFIGHDLAVAEYFCDRIAVMQHGRIVEMGRAQSVFSTPQHAYTQALVAAIPRLARVRAEDRAAPGRRSSTGPSGP